MDYLLYKLEVKKERLGYFTNEQKSFIKLVKRKKSHIIEVNSDEKSD